MATVPPVTCAPLGRTRKARRHGWGCCFDLEGQFKGHRRIAEAVGRIHDNGVGAVGQRFVGLAGDLRERHLEYAIGVQVWQKINRCRSIKRERGAL